MLYSVAHRIWNIAWRIWSGFIVLLVITFLANLGTAESGKFNDLIAVKVVRWLFSLEFLQTFILSALGLIIIITISAGITIEIEKHNKVKKNLEEHNRDTKKTVQGNNSSKALIQPAQGSSVTIQHNQSITVNVHEDGGNTTTTELNSNNDEILQQYLHTIVEMYSWLRLSGFVSSDTFTIANVPLNDIFIHLSDRHIYEPSNEQQMSLEELRQRPDLGEEEREERVQRIRSYLYSQIERIQEQIESTKKKNIAMEEVLQHLLVDPIAIILGAPGSGKSTMLKWLALQMAHVSLASDHYTSDKLLSRKIPILLRISDYAHRFSKEELSFEQFFSEQFAWIHPDLPAKLLIQLKHGNCLMLLDGLDEVVSDSLRLRIADAIHTFISKYPLGKFTSQRYNHYIITSRIIGYESGVFAKYAHYTLLDLEDKEIERFLTNWYLAVERRQIISAQNMKSLTQQQEEQAAKFATEQRNQLLEIFKNNPTIKRLAVNPLMLTMLAMIHRIQKSLPYRRIDLYQQVSRTWLANWTQERALRAPITHLEIPLIEQILGNLAYKLHTSINVFLTVQDVFDSAERVMAEFYGHPPKDSDIRDFIQTIINYIGPFIEIGQGLYSFIHRSFQEYFVVLHLVRKSPEDLKQFVLEHYRITIWREPLLLTIAYKSEQNSRNEKQEASELIKAIANTGDDYEDFLHYGLLFAANSLVDCNPAAIDKELQRDIVNRLFYLYGDSLDTGRYTQLQVEIEKACLLWLRRQQEVSTEQDSLTPLLELWHIALCDANEPLRQEGAVCLLSTIAPDLTGCPKSILLALVPPLLQLADLLDLPCPEEVRVYLPMPMARPSSLKIEEYACIALRLLDSTGPAGWLHETWLKWIEEQPALLERLTEHSLDLDYLITPAALPDKRNNPNWIKQYNISNEWDMQLRNGVQQQQPQLHNLCLLHTQLLHASDAARYPYAFLLLRLLKREKEVASKNRRWRQIWNDFLHDEMTNARSATYRQCLNLRILLYSRDRQKRQSIADELMTALSHQDKQQQIQALIAITNIYLRDMREVRDLIELPSLRNLPGFQYLYYLRDMQYLPNLINMRDLQDLIDLREVRDLQRITDLWYLPKLIDLRDLLDRDRIIPNLCRILRQGATSSSSTVLFALYSITASYSSNSSTLIQQVRSSIQEFVQQSQPLSIELRLLVAAILRRIDTTAPRPLASNSGSTHKADARAMALYALKQHHQLTKQQVEEILAACTDARQPSKDKWQELSGNRFATEAHTVGQIAWELLSQPFSIEADALAALVQSLDDGNAIECAAAALLLQNCKNVPQSVRKEAAQKIMDILKNDELSHRPLDTPDYRIWRLDDVLFETLKGLAEK